MIQQKAKINAIASGSEPSGKAQILGQAIKELVEFYGPGVVYYVDPVDGVDTLNGLDWTNAVKTLQAAIDKCVAGDGDVIICKPGGQTVTSTVNFNKEAIIVMSSTYGISPAGVGEIFALLADASFTDGPVATITERCTIIGLGFASRDTGSTFFSGAAALIGGLATALPFGVHMFRCRFPKWGLDNRTGLAIEGTSDVLIEECYFEGVGSDFENGIYVQGATANLEIKDCRFRDCTYAIRYGTFAGGGPDAIIKGNIVRGGKLLFATTSAPSIVADNWLETATDTGSFNQTVDNMNTDNIQMSDNHYAE